MVVDDEDPRTHGTSVIAAATTDGTAGRTWGYGRFP
jgi:hypothetical protein